MVLIIPEIQRKKAFFTILLHMLHTKYKQFIRKYFIELLIFCLFFKESAKNVLI